MCHNSLYTINWQLRVYDVGMASTHWLTSCTYFRTQFFGVFWQRKKVYFDIRNNQSWGSMSYMVLKIIITNNQHTKLRRTLKIMHFPHNLSIISKQITNEPLVKVTTNIVLQTLLTAFLMECLLGKFMNPKTILCFFAKIRTVKTWN